VSPKSLPTPSLGYHLVDEQNLLTDTGFYSNVPREAMCGNVRGRYLPCHRNLQPQEAPLRLIDCNCGGRHDPPLQLKILDNPVSIREFSQPISGHTNLKDDTDKILVIVDAFT
jgi:hypothetical protein